MKYSKLMKERIRRVRVLFAELGYEVLDGDAHEDTYSAGFESDEGFQGGIFIDRDSKFLELAFTFSFSPTLSEFVRERVDEMLRICYEYGCYVNIQATQEEISYTVFSKIYYAGLNYFSLKETIRDFREAIEAHQDILEINQFGKGTSSGDS